MTHVAANVTHGAVNMTHGEANMTHGVAYMTHSVDDMKHYQHDQGTSDPLIENSIILNCFCPSLRVQENLQGPEMITLEIDF